MLLLRVDDPDRAGHTGHVADTAEGALQLGLLARKDELFLLRPDLRTAGELDFLELLQPLEALVDRGEVREHATEPALLDIRHTDPLRLLLNGLLGLLLGPDEQDRTAVGDGLLHEVVGPVDVGQGLLQVDDVDAIAFGEDKALHLRVPALCLVPEVDTAFEQLLHGDDSHG